MAFLGAAVVPATGVLVALSRTLVIEIPIGVVIIALLITVLVLNQRKKKGPAEKAKPTPQSYYENLQPAANGQGAVPTASPAQADPFAGFAGAPSATPAAPPAPVAGGVANGVANGAVPAIDFGQAAGAVQAPPAPPAPAPTPSAPAVPAGWLPDPSGAPDTLRYWDGSRWTQHVAQRS